ncbi:MAG TPA: serine/threonine-protein kinase [Kofleriaceae bacterium]|nr:serine/threonine-protein kinase [Kofleriaceae bacterium]
MAHGDKGRGGARKSGSQDVTKAPTMDGNAVAVPTPSPSASRPGDDPFLSGADTAIASRSQAMAAQISPEDSSAELPSSAVDTLSDSLVDTTLLERYSITRKIGQGGMGAVYEARHMLIGKRVAVKVLLDKYAQRDPIVARLEQEARLASSIGHEHIIDITDFGQTADGRTFVVMEYLEGEALGQCIQREGQLDEQRAIRIARQIASALGAAHSKGVIHRDIKPDNVFLLQRRETDFVKVVDFGISKAIRPDDADGAISPRLTQTGMVLGTPLYMSPEQARGDDDLDHRIDVYALGVIMYEMVTGEVPFAGSNYLSILSQVINDEPPSPRTHRPDISHELESVIMKALSKASADRYQTMEELAADLSALEAIDGSTTARARISAARYRGPARRKSGLGILAWVAGIAVVVAAVVVTVSAMMGGETKSQPIAAPVLPADAGVAAAGPPVIDADDDRPDVEIVHIRFDSTPVKNAWVYLGDRPLCQTPCRHPFPKENRVLTLVTELEGYDDATIDVNPYIDGDSGTAAIARLRKVKQGAKRRVIPKRAPPPSDSGDGAGKKPNRDDTAAGELTGNPYKK